MFTYTLLYQDNLSTVFNKIVRCIIIKLKSTILHLYEHGMMLHSLFLTPFRLRQKLTFTALYIRTPIYIP